MDSGTEKKQGDLENVSMEECTPCFTQDERIYETKFICLLLKNSLVNKFVVW